MYSFTTVVELRDGWRLGFFLGGLWPLGSVGVKLIIIVVQRRGKSGLIAKFTPENPSKA